MDGGYTGAFEDSSAAKHFKWHDPSDTQRELQAQRDAWQAAWRELEAALRAGHQELEPVAARPAFRRPSRKFAAAFAA